MSAILKDSRNNSYVILWQELRNLVYSNRIFHIYVSKAWENFLIMGR